VNSNSVLRASIVLVGLDCLHAFSQSLGSGSLVPEPADFALLESKQPRKDLPCAVSPIKPAVSFNFTFHSGYRVTMPTKELAGLRNNDLVVFLRVVPLDRPEDTMYMAQRLHVPAQLWEDSAGGAQGVFELGEGRYHVDWMVRDRQFRVCTKSWELEAKLSHKDASLTAWIAPALIRVPVKLFEKEPVALHRPGTDLLKVDIIANFAPQNHDAVVLAAKDLDGLVEILHGIARDPHIGEYSVVACSLPAQKVFYRQTSTNGIDFHAIGEALESLNPGLVDVKTLSAKNGTANFVAGLLEESKKRDSDALIIVGSKVAWNPKMPREALDPLGNLDRPLFYLDYNGNPADNPGRDFLRAAVKLKRGVVYNITYPKDLFHAWSDILARTVKARKLRTDGEKAMDVTPLQ